MTKCALCKSAECDDVQYGELITKGSMSVHTFCLYLTSNLCQKGSDNEGFLGFMQADIKAEVQRISHLNCSYCHKRFANIGCCEQRCRRTFHLICGIKNNAQNQFFGTYNSYCHQHVHLTKHKQPAANENCCICLDRLIEPNRHFNAVTMLSAPCCRNGWFHKLCLQTCAKAAGYYFKCPLCNNQDVFLEKLSSNGIYIPMRDAAWELESGAYAELLEQPHNCSAIPCLNAAGAEQDDERNPFIICDTCGALAMHKLCLAKGKRNYRCADCEQMMCCAGNDSGHEEDEKTELDEHIDVEGDVDLDALELTVNVAAVSDTSNETDLSDTLAGEKESDNEQNDSADNSETDEDDLTLDRLLDISKTPNKHINTKQTACAQQEKTTIDSDWDSEDDDPLEFIEKILKQGKPQQNKNMNNKEITCAKASPALASVKPMECSTLNISCVANRTRKRKSIINNNAKTLQAISEEDQQPHAINEMQEQPTCSKNIRVQCYNGKANVDESDNSEQNQAETPSKQQLLNISCVAQRTRHRKSNVFLTQAAIAEDSDDDGDDEDATSSISSYCTVASQGKPLDISCIANRTRKRKSLTSCNMYEVMSSNSAKNDKYHNDTKSSSEYFSLSSSNNNSTNSINSSGRSISSSCSSDNANNTEKCLALMAKRSRRISSSDASDNENQSNDLNNLHKATKHNQNSTAAPHTTTNIYNSNKNRATINAASSTNDCNAIKDTSNSSSVRNNFMRSYNQLVYSRNQQVVTDFHNAKAN